MPIVGLHGSHIKMAGFEALQIVTGSHGETLQRSARKIIPLRLHLKGLRKNHGH